jgi:5-hydroxyisourate hydrolase-like protein (transthyretin family)
MTIVRSAVVLLALLGAASAAHAQVIHGRLLDNATGAPIVRGQVTLMQGTRTVMRDAITDDDGRFMLRLRGAGAYRLRGQSIGYRESISSEVHLLPADTIHVELRLEVDMPITYSSYLRLQELLELQSPASEPAEHDETLFIVVHQVGGRARRDTSSGSSRSCTSSTGCRCCSTGRRAHA